ncbi:SAM-dependent chlorinase/fluorinase [bacterium]|nr:SAM-dependent chlorinase/fluorinase [bacterium]
MSHAPVITLTTDYGDTAPYAAVLKGVILGINPAARVHDLTHHIRPQDVAHGSYYLGVAAPYFPPGTIHVAVVDPGVGGARHPIYAEAGGQRLVGPDNGLFTHVFRHIGGPTCVRRLAESRFWKHPVSATFHGRDVFAPVAAHLSLGVDPAELGPELPAPVLLPTDSAVTFGGVWEGVVQTADDFGNLVTNIPADKLKTLPVAVAVGGAPARPIPWVRTYGEAPPGELVCLFSSDGFFEVAVVNGSAARQLGAGPGAAVRVEPA